MYICVTDNQAVAASEGQMFSMLQQSPIAAQTVLSNVGDNIIGYRFQQLIAGSWHDIESLGNPLNTTLSPAETSFVTVASSYPQVRMLAYASGGSELNFAVQRFANRPDGGTVPLINLS